MSVPITAADDNLLDGIQTVQIDVSASGYSGNSASVEVRDEETLSVTFASPTISEKNGSVTVVIQRSNTDVSLPLVVALVSSDTSELTVEATVTIPANQTQVSFIARSVDERVIDGTAIVEVVATAQGYSSGRGSVQVTDNDPEFPWQNPRNPLDVNDDGRVTPIDALLVINALNNRFQLTPELPVPFDPVQYLDVDGNDLVTPIDALLVINQLNLQVTGEGEESPFDPRKSRRR